MPQLREGGEEVLVVPPLLMKPHWGRGGAVVVYPQTIRPRMEKRERNGYSGPPLYSNINTVVKQKAVAER